MRIGVVVDSTCDLPAAFFENRRIGILPITIQVDGQTLSDTRDPAETARFLSERVADRGHDAETAPYSVEQIREVFLSRLVLEHDFVFCLTVTSTRSPIFANATQASFAILKDYKAVRAAANVTGPFLLRVIDTQNLFAAQGVTAVEAVRMAEAGESPARIRERLEYLAQNTYGYVIPRDLYYVRARAQKKGDRSVSWVSAALGTALDVKPLLHCYRGETRPVAKLRGFEHTAEKLLGYAAGRVRAGLLTPTLCLSYGGDLAELEALPGYAGLMQVCAEAGVEAFTSPMSITGMVNLGAGALALGFAAPEHTPAF